MTLTGGSGAFDVYDTSGPQVGGHEYQVQLVLSSVLGGLGCSEFSPEVVVAIKCAGLEEWLQPAVPPADLEPSLLNQREANKARMAPQSCKLNGLCPTHLCRGLTRARACPSCAPTGWLLGRRVEMRCAPRQALPAGKATQGMTVGSPSCRGQAFDLSSLTPPAHAACALELFTAACRQRPVTFPAPADALRSAGRLH